MKLTIEQVEHIALLARLNLTQEEKERYSEQLSAILDYADSLKEIDTSGILPTSSVLSKLTVLRADITKSGLTREDLLRNAPEQRDNQFKVPAILE
jgi:aspartyl-tRNA(Asn)/glutamyl-tRNA(Gln) amidotransferase subunit C